MVQRNRNKTKCAEECHCYSVWVLYKNVSNIAVAVIAHKTLFHVFNIEAHGKKKNGAKITIQVYIIHIRTFVFVFLPLLLTFCLPFFFFPFFYFAFRNETYLLNLCLIEQIYKALLIISGKFLPVIRCYGLASNRFCFRFCFSLFIFFSISAYFSGYVHLYRLFLKSIYAYDTQTEQSSTFDNRHK